MEIETCLLWTDFAALDAFLNHEMRPGDCLGVDAPMGLPKRFLQEMGWPLFWPDAAANVLQMTKSEWYECLAGYKMTQPTGKKEPLRETDRDAKSLSPLKCYGVPLAGMFYEAMKRLHHPYISIFPCKTRPNAPSVIETYPKIIAKAAIGKHTYKQDTVQKQTAEQKNARQAILDYVQGSTEFGFTYGFSVGLTPALYAKSLEDATGDTLDSVLCCIQAAWFAQHQPLLLQNLTPQKALEGWIIDPALV